METGIKEVQKEELMLKGKSIIQKQQEDKMYSNPFLFEVSDSDFYSVEDFFIEYQNNYVKFEDFVRNDKITNFERKKVINNQLSIWKKEVEQNIYKVFKDSQEAVLKCKKNTFIKVGFKTFFLLLISVSIPIVLLLNLISFIPFTEEYYVYGALALIALSILGLMFALIYNFSIFKFNNLLSKHKSLHQKNSSKVFKKLKKNCKKVKKHYTKNFENQIYTKDSLDIEKINDLGKILSNLNNSTIGLKESYERVYNQGKKSKFCFKMAKILSTFTFIISIGSLITLLILNIINK